MTINGVAFGVLNFIDLNRYYVYKGGSKEINEIWIQPIISAEDKAISFFPFFGYRYIGAPYQVGLRAVDYGHKKQSTKMEITELVIFKGNSSLNILENHPVPVIVSFEKYLLDIDHFAAKWEVPIGEWLTVENKEAVTFRAKYKVYTKDSVIEGNIGLIFKLEHYERLMPFYKMWE